MEKRGESLDTKIQKLDKELARYTEQMKKMKPGPAKQAVQKRAMAILKQKKMYEGQKEKTMNQQFNMEQIMFAQDGLKETADTVSAMKTANKELKKQFKAININQVAALTRPAPRRALRRIGRRRSLPRPPPTPCVASACAGGRFAGRHGRPARAGGGGAGGARPLVQHGRH
jgi:hypothetical protein